MLSRQRTGEVTSDDLRDNIYDLCGRIILEAQDTQNHLGAFADSPLKPELTNLFRGPFLVSTYVTL